VQRVSQAVVGRLPPFRQPGLQLQGHPIDANQAAVQQHRYRIDGLIADDKPVEGPGLAAGGSREVPATLSTRLFADDPGLRIPAIVENGDGEDDEKGQDEAGKSRSPDGHFSPPRPTSWPHFEKRSLRYGVGILSASGQTL
jgi:hypothetical protein